MKKIYLLILFVLFCGCLVGQEILTNQLSGIKKIGKLLSFLEDKQGSYTLEQILEPEYQSKFEPFHKDVFVRPVTESVYWFRFTLQNQSGKEIWLHCGTLYARDVIFYSSDSLGNYQPFEPGKEWNGREIDEASRESSRFLLFNSGEEREKTFYLRVKEDVPFELPLQVGTLSALNRAQSLSDYFAAGFIGALLIMILYNCFIWISTREKLYFIYILYLFFMMVSVPFQNNFPFLTLGIDYQLWHKVIFARLGLALITVGIFAMVYLNLKKELKKGYYLLVIILSVIGLLSLISLFYRSPLLVDSFQVSVAILFGVCLYSAYYLLFLRRKQAFYYALGWTFMAISVIVYMLTINGYMSYNAFTRNATYFGISIEAWLFALALADRMNEMRKEKELAQLVLLEQITENEKIVRTQNEVLEIRVRERTHELQEKRDTIAQQAEELMITLEKLNVQNKEIADKNEQLNLLADQLNANFKVLEEQTEQLKLLNSTKDKFFSILAHDLMNPLNALLGYSSLLIEALSNGETEECKSYSRVIDYSAQRISWLLQNLLVWTRSQSEKIVPVPRVTNIHEMITESINITSPAASFKNISISVELENDLRANFDYNMISTVVRNLMLTAIKHAEKGGEVVVSARRRDHELLFRISDNGNSLDKKQVEELFSLNRILTQKGPNSEAGTGLGLAIGKEFVEMHSGKIWAESTSDKGCNLCFTIPVNLSAMNSCNN